MSRKTIIQSISFQPDMFNYIQASNNSSALIDEALREHKERRTNNELKIKLLKDQKRELIKKINLIDDEIRELK